MSGRKNESTVEIILKKIGLAGHPRDRATLKNLAQAMVHPGELANTAHLSEDDPLKISARLVMDDFEAVTNGMGRRQQNDEPMVSASDYPFGPWQLLTDAIAGFYAGDITRMKRFADAIPRDTAAAALRDVFETLAGRPVLSGNEDDFTKTLRTRRIELADGLETLDEASAYPDILRNEIIRYLPLIAQENEEAAKRLYYWAMEVLVEDEPINESDELSAAIPGSGEASRICALASMNYDIDRAFIAWLRSLEAVLKTGKIEALETTVRLKIAGEIAAMAEQQHLLTQELSSRACEILSGSYNLLKDLLPQLKPLPSDSLELCRWLEESGADYDNQQKLKPGIKTSVKRRQPERVNQELLLFDEASL